jgi:hypothetical protein
MMEDIAREEFIEAFRHMDIVRIQVEDWDKSFETLTDTVQHPKRYRFVIIMEVRQ